MRYRAEDFQKDFWVNIGKRIRLRREQFGLTRDQLSYEIGVSEKTLGQIERGEQGCSVAHLFMIASKLNISVDRLLKGTPQETLLERGLIRTHQGFFANPVHIKSIESDYVFCINDIEVPISHRERKNLIKKFSERYASMISKV